MPDFHFDNQAELHHHFSKHCFNRASELMEQSHRTQEETKDMVNYSLASLFHWSKRADCTQQQKSIGCWQISRCYTLAGDLDQGERYGKLCLKFSMDEQPFYLGYAYEALARIASLKGNNQDKIHYLNKAKYQLKIITNPEEKSLLISDLESIR